MVAPLYTDICAGVRALLDDLIVPGGATYTDTYLQLYVEQANETLTRFLIANSVERMKFRTETPITVTAGTTILDYASSAGGAPGTNVLQLLPDDLDVPDQLFEAKVGGLNEDFFPMSGPNPISTISQSDRLGSWNWYDGRIHLLGATADRDVRIVYWSALAAVNPAARIKVVAMGPALVSLTASLAAQPKGQFALADRYATFDKDNIGGKAGFEIAQIINAEIKMGQSEPTRRQPMYGQRYSNQNYQNYRRT